MNWEVSTFYSNFHKILGNVLILVLMVVICLVLIIGSIIIIDHAMFCDRNAELNRFAL